MEISEVRRYSRHLALSEIGAQGQTRILQGVVALVDAPGADLAMECAGLYLGSAGVGTFRVVLGKDRPIPGWLAELRLALPHARFDVVETSSSGGSWALALDRCDVAIRASFGDDAFVEACRRRKVRAVVIRSTQEDPVIDVLSLRPSEQTIISDVPSIPPSPPSLLDDLSPAGASQWIVAGTLAAAEALWLLAGRSFVHDEAASVGCIRHLSLPLSNLEERPRSLNIPWPPV